MRVAGGALPVISGSGRVKLAGGHSIWWARLRFADAETRLRRLREAIEAGAHPEALVDSINDAQARRAAARAELDAVGPAPDLMSDAEVYARLDALSDIKTDLSRANAARLRKIYADVRLEMVYDPEARAVDASIRPLGG